MNSRWGLLFVLALVGSCGGNGVNSSNAPTSDSSSKSSEADTRVVQDFVQEFYSWYVPAAANKRSSTASDMALETRPSAFDASLARQLKEDSDAQAKVKGDIVGLDFDPFLAAQDPCERYEVVDVQKKAESYLVGVRGVGGCEKHDKADVIAEVASKNGTLSFVNFHYPGFPDGDLLTLLRKMREDRR
jgi:hypothetical protein